MTAPNLTLQDRLDIIDAQSYLKAHADLNFDRMPEGSLAGVFNQLSPAARDYLKQQQAKVANFRESAGRSAPFEQKRYLDDLKLPDHVQKTVAKADTEDITYKLNQRMGTGEQQERIANRAPDLRETLTASFDAHESDSNG